MNAYQGRFDNVALSEQRPQLTGHGFNQKFGVAHDEAPVEKFWDSGFRVVNFSAGMTSTVSA
jgi:hypothetical protein